MSGFGPSTADQAIARANRHIRADAKAARAAAKRPPLQQSRAVSSPIQFGQSDLFRGMGSQPAPDDLLRESLGFTAMAVRAIANRVASLQWNVVRKDSSGEEEILVGHPLKAILDSPSPLHSKRATFGLTTQYVLTLGEGYLLKVGSVGQFEGRSTPRELFVLQGGRVWPKVSGGVVSEYVVLTDQGTKVSLAPEDVIRIWWPDPETLYTSEGILGPQSISIDADKFASSHLKNRFQHDARPPITIEGDKDAEAPGSQAEYDVWHEQWRKAFRWDQGTQRGLPAWLAAGWKAHVIDQPSGQELVPLLEFWRDQHLMAHATPRAVLGQVVAGDRSSAEVQQWAFDRYAVTPVVELIAEGLTLGLARDFGMDLAIRAEQFVQDDKRFLLEQETADVAGKIRSPNEIRERRDRLDPASWGELPVGTLADQPYDGEAIELGDFGDFEDPEDEPEDDDNEPRGERGPWRADPDAEWARVLDRERLFLPKLTRAVRGVFKTQLERVLKAFGELRSADRQRVEPESYLAAVRTVLDALENEPLFEVRIERFRRVIYQRAADDGLSSALKQATQFAPTIASQKQLEEMAARLRQRVNATTVALLTKRLESELATSTALAEDAAARQQRVERVTRNEFFERRKQAKRVAQTELLETVEAAQLEGFRASEVVNTKRWHSSRDGLVRDSHRIDGQTVPLDQAFVLSDGEPADAPGVGAGGSQLSPRNKINCRCFVVPVVED